MTDTGRSRAGTHLKRLNREVCRAGLEQVTFPRLPMLPRCYFASRLGSPHAMHVTYIRHVAGTSAT